jgi:hypothetical protein
MAEIKNIVLPVGGHQNNPTVPPVVPAGLTELTIGNDKYNINTNGDAVDTTGKVIKTKVELETLKNPAPVLTEAEKAAKLLADAEAAKKADKLAAVDSQLIEGAEIELDDIKYKLNKDGNAVDATGKVVKTKDELKALLIAAEERSNELDYIAEIQKATNLTIVGENNQPITYENTVSGITQYVQDIHKEGRKLGATEYERELLTRYPILNDVIQHLTINGSLKDFVEDVDYGKVTISDDEKQHIDIYTKAKLKQGLSQNEITDLIGYLKADKKLKAAAETSLTYLRTDQTNAATKRANDIAAIRASEDAERITYWNEVKNIITSKQLVVGDKKFTIPEIIKVKEADGKIATKTLKDFQDYIEKPLNFNIDGQIYTMTQLEYDEAIEDTKRTPHHDLFDAYRKFTKYDDSQLIAANASDNVVKKIIKLSTKASGGVSGAAGKGGKLVLPIK